MRRGQRDLLNGSLAAKQLGSLEVNSDTVNSEQTVSVSEAHKISTLAQRERVRERGQYNCAKHLDIDSIRVPQEHRKGLSHYFTVHCSQKQAAFTLAEVLITLAIIGVVATITMPMLITNINDRVNFERHVNIAYKVTQAMEQMRAHGKLVQYASTSAFVDELQKYLKITKRCSADNIAECWPTETVINGDGEEYNVSDAKKRKNLLPNVKSGDKNDDNVSLILADGASIILTYDNSKAGKDIGDKVTAKTITNPKGQEIAYSTTSAEGIDFVTDVNGKKGPNKEGKDILSFSVATFAKSGHACDDGPEGCLYRVPTYDPVNCCRTAENMATEEYKAYCGSGYADTTYCATDYWAGANKACKDAGMTLPDTEKLHDIWEAKGEYTGPLAYLSSIGNVWFWSSEESSNDPQNTARDVPFLTGNALITVKYGQRQALCVGE